MTGAGFQLMSRRRLPGKQNSCEGRLLIVCDDARDRRALHGTLFNLGFDIAEAATGEESVAQCRIMQYDAILLDLVSRGSAGTETCAELRRLLPRAAILLIGDSNDQECRVEALEAGADAWLSKPVQVRELTAQVRNILGWALLSGQKTEQTILIGDVLLNPVRRLVHKAGSSIHLTPNEFELLHCLMTNAGMPVSHARLIDIVWRNNPGIQMDSLRTLVCQLRKKIENDPGSPRYVLTEGRTGYRFADPEDGL
jgi:two-component system KDP operon response regulator KdpE